MSWGTLGIPFLDSVTLCFSAILAVYIQRYDAGLGTWGKDDSCRLSPQPANSSSGVKYKYLYVDFKELLERILGTLKGLLIVVDVLGIFCDMRMSAIQTPP